MPCHTTRAGVSVSTRRTLKRIKLLAFQFKFSLQALRRTWSVIFKEQRQRACAKMWVHPALHLHEPVAIHARSFQLTWIAVYSSRFQNHKKTSPTSMYEFSPYVARKTLPASRLLQPPPLGGSLTYVFKNAGHRTQNWRTNRHLISATIKILAQTVPMFRDLSTPVELSNAARSNIPLPANANRSIPPLRARKSFQ